MINSSRRCMMLSKTLGKALERNKQVTKANCQVLHHHGRVGTALCPCANRCRKRTQTRGDQETFEFDCSGVFLTISLLMRLDISLLGDFLALYQRGSTGTTRCKLAINLQVTRVECIALIKRVGDAMQFAHIVEGCIFLAQLLYTGAIARHLRLQVILHQRQNTYLKTQQGFNITSGHKLWNLQQV